MDHHAPFFDSQFFAAVDRMSLGDIDQKCTQFFGFSDDAAECIRYGRLLRHLRDNWSPERHGVTFNQWAAPGPHGKPLQHTQRDKYIKIAALDDAEFEGLRLSVDVLAALAAGPLGRGPAAEVRAKLIELGQKTPSQGKRLDWFKQAVSQGVFLLNEGVPVDPIKARCAELARGKGLLPGSGSRPDAGKQEREVLAQVRKVNKVLKQWEEEGTAPGHQGSPLQQELADLLQSASRLRLIEPATRVENEQKSKQDEELGKPAADADRPVQGEASTGPPAQQEAGAQGLPAEAEERRHVPRDTVAGDRVQAKDQAGEHDPEEAAPEEDEVPEQDGLVADDSAEEDDLAEEGWYRPIAQGIKSALPAPEQQAVGKTLCGVVRGDEVATFEGELRPLWQRCGLEAAGVDRSHYDFLMDQLCGADRLVRGIVALALLEEMEPPDWGWNVHRLSRWTLPPFLQQRVRAICERVEPVAVEPLPEGAGPQEVFAREMRIARLVAERGREDIPDGAFAVQRLVRDELTNCYRAVFRLGYRPPPRPPLFPFGKRVFMKSY